MYPEQLVAPMRADLTTAGFHELKTPADVESSLKEQGTTLMVINSVCGCAAGAARPGIKWALQNSAKKPAHLTTVFAGVDKEAVAKARELHFLIPHLLQLLRCLRTESLYTLLSVIISKAEMLR